MSYTLIDNDTGKDIIETITNQKEEIERLNKENERLNNIINEIEKELDLNLPFKVIGVRGLKSRIKELKGGTDNE